MAEAKSFRDLVGVPRSSASASNSTLIIIDAQNEYADGHLKVDNVASTRRAIGSLLSTYRKSGNAKNIIHVTHQVPAGAPVFTPDTKLAEEFEELAPQKGEKTIVKMHPGSFTDTDLQEYLQGTDAKKLVLTG